MRASLAASGALAAALSLTLAASAAAADAVSARAERAASLPDWSGVWARSGPNVFDPATVDPPRGGAGAPGVREHPPYNAAWEAKYLANIERVKQDTLPDPLNSCLLRGMPGMMSLPDQYEFVVTPEQVWIFAENGAQVRRIYTDGRKHPAGAALIPTFTGDSVGHWEGDTLVVNTVGLRDDMIIDRTGAILSTKATIDERIRMADHDTIEDKLVMTDPEALTRPWTVTRLFKRQAPDAQLFDYACAENNRNPVQANGNVALTGPNGERLDD
jgi:hypothetical protein